MRMPGSARVGLLEKQVEEMQVQMDALEEERMERNSGALVATVQQVDAQEQMQMLLQRVQERMVKVEVASAVQEAQEQVQMAANVLQEAEAQQRMAGLADVVQKAELATTEEVQNIWSWLDGDGRGAREAMDNSEEPWTEAQDYTRQCLAGRVEQLEEEDAI